MAPQHTSLPARCLLLVFVLSFRTNMGVNGDVLTLMDTMSHTPQFGELKRTPFHMDDSVGTNQSAPSGNSKTGMDTLITEGHNAYPAEFGYQVALLANTSIGMVQFCGGVLLSSRHILTAAHCMIWIDTFDYFVAVGVHNITLGNLNPGSQIVPVASYEIHPFFSGTKEGYPNDIGMLYVDTPIIENQYVKYAVLATPEMGLFDHYFCIVTGWGNTEDGRPELLQFGYQYIPTIKDCRLFWAIHNGFGISQKHVCGYYHPTSACFGDSGGPLSCSGYVVGLVSWGLGNCSGCFPVAYTRITHHHRWIDNALKK